jgi:hypothetical protein
MNVLMPHSGDFQIIAIDFENNRNYKMNMFVIIPLSGGAGFVGHSRTGGL